MSAHITEFIVKDTDDNEYFAAHLDNGMVRIGLRAYVCFDFPATHASYERVVALTADQIEDVYDEFYAKYIATR